MKPFVQNLVSEYLTTVPKHDVHSGKRLSLDGCVPKISENHLNFLRLSFLYFSLVTFFLFSNFALQSRLDQNSLQGPECPQSSNL